MQPFARAIPPGFRMTMCILISFFHPSLHGQNFSTIRFNGTANVHETVQWPGCQITKTFACAPTHTTASNPDESVFGDIAENNHFIYYLSMGGSLYRRNNNDSTSCLYFGSFHTAYKMNSLVSDSADVLFAAGYIQNSLTASLFRYQSGAFSKLGDFPPGYYPAGDLFFFEQHLFLTVTDTAKKLSWLMEVNIPDPSQSCIYMKLPWSGVHGAFSTKSGAVSHAYVNRSTSSSTDVYELDIPCRKVGPLQCSLPRSFLGAGHPYDSTSLNHTCSGADVQFEVKGKDTICAGKTLQLNAVGADQYLWSNGSTGSTCTFLPLQSGTIQVTGSYTAGCSNNSSVIAYVVNPNPTITVAGASTLCAGATLSLTATGADSYSWNSGTTGSVLVGQPFSSGTFVVTGTSHGECTGSASWSIHVKYPATPVVEFGYPSPICMNPLLVFPVKDSAFTEGGHFTSTLPVNDVTGVIDISNVSEGVYEVSYFREERNCENAAIYSASVNVVFPPRLSLHTHAKVATGGTVMLHASGCDSYTWDPPDELNCVNCAEPVATGTESRQYCVKGEHLGCYATACMTLEVGCFIGDFSLPSAFSPNNDGRNDAYCIQGWNLCPVKFSIIIFTRWGQKVFESDDPAFCWDGTFNGATLDEDVLVYSVKASYEDGTTVSKKGDITVIK